MRTRHATALFFSLLLVLIFWLGSELFKMQRLSVIQEGVDSKKTILSQKNKKLSTLKKKVKKAKIVYQQYEPYMVDKKTIVQAVEKMNKLLEFSEHRFAKLKYEKKKISDDYMNVSSIYLTVTSLDSQIPKDVLYAGVCSFVGSVLHLKERECHKEGNYFVFNVRKVIEE